MDNHQMNGSDNATKNEVEKTDRSIFELNFRKKEEGKPVDDVEIVHADDKKGLLDMIKEKLPAQHKKAEGGSANADGKLYGEKEENVNAEVTDAGDMKGLLDKIKDKLPGQHKKTDGGSGKEETVNAEATDADDKKGLLDKIKDKLPGQHKKAEEGASPTKAEDETKEKKGLVETIKEKIPAAKGQKSWMPQS